MINGPKRCWNLNDSTFPYLLIPVKTIQVEKVSLNHMQYLRTAWYLMRCRWEVLSSEQRQFIATFSDAIISETKNIFGILFFFFFFFFVHILNLDPILNIFKKKKWPWWLIYFWTYGRRNTWLDKSLKTPVSEDPWTSNMVNGPKHGWNLNYSTITIFIDPCEGNSSWKSLSEWYAKFRTVC